MASGSHVQLFISCVSAEFRSYREALRKGLARHNVTIHIQEDFIAGGVPTLNKLDTYIAGCDAVIHLAGDMTGAMANPHSLDAIKALHPDLAAHLPPLKDAIETGAPQLSYTQWEAYLAIYHRKMLIIAEPSDTAPREGTYQNDAAQISAQKVHLERLAALARYPEIRFSSAETLVNGALNAVLDLIAAESEIRLKPINLPYPSLGDLFKGRDEFLIDLHTSLARSENGNAAIVGKAVHGLGGIGKTRLAVEYAWQHEADYTALLFVPAEARAESADVTPKTTRHVQASLPDLWRNLAALADPLILDLPEHKIPDEDRRAIGVIRWLQQHPGWLLIIDNVDSEESASEVEKLLRQLRGGHVLITSRRRSWSKQIEPKELGALSATAATSFLLESTTPGRRVAADDVAQAADIANELGHLALALEQAVSYINRHHISFAGYLKIWRENSDAVAARYDAQATNYPLSIAVTWQTSVTQLNYNARKLLHLLSFLSSEPIPEALLDVPDSGSSNGDQRAALSALAVYSLVTLAKDERMFRVHPLVQEVTRRSMDSSTRQRTLSQSLAWLNSATAGAAKGMGPQLTLNELAPHTTALMQHASAELVGLSEQGRKSAHSDSLNEPGPLRGPLFVSHAGSDLGIAMGIVSGLERRRIGCWIAPRNIQGGRPYPDAIAEAIDSCEALLLLLSSRANESEEVQNEVGMAHWKHKLIIPVRIEAVEPAGRLFYHIGLLHRIDAFENREEAITAVIQSLP